MIAVLTHTRGIVVFVKMLALCNHLAMLNRLGWSLASVRSWCCGASLCYSCHLISVPLSSARWLRFNLRLKLRFNNWGCFFNWKIWINFFDLLTILIDRDSIVVNQDYILFLRSDILLKTLFLLAFSLTLYLQRFRFILLVWLMLMDCCFRDVLVLMLVKKFTYF